MKFLWSWILAGALLASLTWNWTLYHRARAAAAAATTARDATCCGVDPAGFGLDAEQQKTLGALCASSCGESDRLERQADELQRALIASLSRETVDPAATEKLVGEVSELRRRSLAACVQGILGVRALLAPAQMHELIQTCDPGPAGSRR